MNYATTFLCRSKRLTTDETALCLSLRGDFSQSLQDLEMELSAHSVAVPASSLRSVDAKKR